MFLKGEWKNILTKVCLIVLRGMVESSDEGIKKKSINSSQVQIEGSVSARSQIWITSSISGGLDNELDTR